MVMVSNDDVCNHSPAWKKASADVKNLVQCMLKIDPTERVSASECLLHPWITGRAHTQEHLQPMPEVQEAMRARIERKKRKADAKK
jgi:serine/threonine protein kinase